MVCNLTGIIIAYDSMTGVILLKSDSARSLEEEAERYVRSKNDHGFWLAKFMWSAVDPTCRSQIQASVGDRLVRDMILGCQAVCRLEQKPKWQAQHMTILLDDPKFPLPKRRRRNATGQRKEKPRNRQGMTSFSRSTLDGRGSGVVLPPGVWDSGRKSRAGRECRKPAE